MRIQVIDGIVKRLRQAFGSEYRIYTEDKKQGMNTPCFFVSPVHFGYQEGFQNRAKNEDSYVIHYFPDDKAEPKAACIQMQDSLSYLMRQIEVEGAPIWGGGISGVIEDGVLHFYVDYHYRIRYEEDEGEVMEELTEVSQSTKGE